MSKRFLHSPADVLRWLLVFKREGSDPNLSVDWPVFKGREPSNPDNVITVYDTTPQDDGRTMVDGEDIHHYGVQIRIRGVTDPVAYVKAESIHVTLSENTYYERIAINDRVNPSALYLVHSISKQSLVAVGRDAPASTRYLYTINALMTMTLLQP